MKEYRKWNITNHHESVKHLNLLFHKANIAPSFAATDPRPVDLQLSDLVGSQPSLTWRAAKGVQAFAFLPYARMRASPVKHNELLGSK
jgi:hypothetical protein